MTTPTLQKIIDAPVARVEIGKEWFDLSKTNVYSLSQLQQAYQAGRKDALVEAANKFRKSLHVQKLTSMAEESEGEK